MHKPGIKTLFLENAGRERMGKPGPNPCARGAAPLSSPVLNSLFAKWDRHPYGPRLPFFRDPSVSAPKGQKPERPQVEPVAPADSPCQDA